MAVPETRWYTLPDDVVSVDPAYGLSEKKRKNACVASA